MCMVSITPQVADRVNMILTLMLTIVAFKFVMNSYLPATSDYRLYLKPVRIDLTYLRIRFYITLSCKSTHARVHVLVDIMTAFP